jgi:hypothetical protein
VQLSKNRLDLWAKVDVVKEMDMCTKMKQLGVEMQKQIVIVLRLSHDFITNFMFLKKKHTFKKKKFSLKITTITYNVKRCLRESLPRKFLCLMFGHNKSCDLCSAAASLPPSQVPLPDVQNKILRPLLHSSLATRSPLRHLSRCCLRPLLRPSLATRSPLRHLFRRCLRPSR